MIKYSTKKHTMRQGRLAKKKIQHGLVVRLLMLSVVVVMSVGYVTVTSSVSTKGYDISSLQNDIMTIEKDIEIIDYETAKYRSMSSIKERLTNMDFEKASQVTYLKVDETGGVVARR
jgi:hypothetical protein